MSADARLEVHDLSKSFDTPQQRIEVLRGLSFRLEGGESLAVTGPSGSGKSTLLHILGTLDRPDTGQVTIRGSDPFTLPEPELAAFRNQHVGFIFQDHHLLPQYSVLENVLVPTLVSRERQDAPQRARQLLDQVGLSQRLEHRPAELSGGERQRVAVARALINGPGLVLCDEPTGSLDGQTAAVVADLLLDLHRREKTVLVVVTHSLELAALCDRRCELREGRCSEP